MVTRRSSSRFFLTLSAAVLVTGAAGFAITACSSSTTDSTGTPATEAGSDTSTPRADASVTPEEDSATPEPQTEEECVAACNTKHATGVPKYNAIDTCWAASCKGPCVDDPPTGYDAGADASDAGVANLCGTGLNTFSDDCDYCTQASCCAEWSGCFDDAECSALDDCIGACFQ